jgi:hypothetical protein
LPTLGEKKELSKKKSNINLFNQQLAFLGNHCIILTKLLSPMSSSEFEYEL